MIAVSGAAGKTGRAILRALGSRRVAVRPLVRQPSGLEGERVVDLLDPASVTTALEGVEAVYLMAPNMHPAEREIGRLMIEAARRSGVAKIVYHSVLHPQLESMPHHWEKLRVEQAVIESSLRWTILQPAPYAQNFARPLDGVLRIAYRASAQFSFVDLADVGEAAAVALTSSAFESGIYELAGPEVLTVADVAAALGAPLEMIHPEAWERTALAGGMAAGTAARLVAMFRHYDEHGLVGNPAALTLCSDERPRRRFPHCSGRRPSSGPRTGDSRPPPPAWRGRARSAKRRDRAPSPASWAPSPGRRY
jgi:NAD(P)H dehydrogenase (quinone)